jgi:3-deoxy-7-phosphoheptulonate synthase
MQKTYDLHITETRPLISPAFLHHELPITETAATLVAQTRDRIRNILRNEDHRLLVIVGPCSVHDVDAALDYGQQLVALRQELAEDLEIIMRVYFEKPRTSIGWKGLINDPNLDDSYDINKGPQYIADIIAWTAIGARTTESQTHREMASGLSMPIGFKNNTDGSLQAAINAMLSASQPHHFLGINHHGLASIVATTGNPDTHLVLRGGKSGPNYDAKHIDWAAKELLRLNLNARVMVDCSHANALKDYNRQVQVLDAIAEQLHDGQRHLLGVMIESHLVAGNQSIPRNLADLVYGQSVTDPCVDMQTTATMLRHLAKAVRHCTKVLTP